MNKYNPILASILVCISISSWADSYRISVKEFNQDSNKVAALKAGIEKMRANNTANPLSPEFRTSFNYWANTHGYFGSGKHATNYQEYITDYRLPQCYDTFENNKDVCDQYYQHLKNVDVPNDGFTNDVWGTCQHGNLEFLPWHRMMLYFYEKTVRKYVGGDYSLPYWDYYEETSANGNGLALPQMVRGVQAGTLYDQYRTPGLNEYLTAIDSETASAYQAFTNSDFTGFSNTLQGQPHGAMHCAVGYNCVLPDMGLVPIAGQDPVFYMHHANIDRLWQCWLNKKAAGQPITLDWAKKNLGMPDSWYDTTYTFADENGDKVTMSIADVFTPGKIPVRYSNELNCDIQAPSLMTVSNTKNTRAFKSNHRPVSSNQPIQLFGVTQQISLNPQTQKFFQSTNRVTKRKLNSGETYLILENVEMIGQPALTYKIYLSSEKNPENKIYVATINYFAVDHHAHSDHAKQGHIGQLVYQVSHHVQQIGVSADDLKVQFVPTDLTTNSFIEKKSESGLRISQVRIETIK